MSPLPSISILVMSYNQEAFIGDCVDSVLSQEYDGELEFIFCDDNSTDSTFSIISEKVRQYTGPRRVIAHKCPTNGRVAVNMNTAVKLSQFDWLMRVDGDDILHPDRTALSAYAILNHPDAVAVSGQLSEFREKPISVTNPSHDKIEYDIFDASNLTERSKPDRLEWWGGVMTISKRIFDEFGELPATCDILDDTMFAARTLMLGKFVIMRNATLLYYRRHNANVSSSQTRDHTSTLSEYIQSDLESRNYYERGIRCQQPILDEIKYHVESHPEHTTLLQYFNYRFDEQQRQAFFWKKSWKERIADAGISGPFWKKIPWAIRVMNPLTYALAAKYMKKS